MSTERKHYSPEEKIQILKKHLLEKKPLSDVCDHHGIHPTVFYRWQKQFFEQGASVFQSSKNTKQLKLEKKIVQLEQKLSQKNEVLSELMEEHVLLKKVLGKFE
jgi:transposase-like protein